MAYTKYSLTPANNNAAPPDGAPEGMLPSAVNDTMRDMMAQIRDVGDGIRDGTYTMTAPVITGGSIDNTTVGATTPSTVKTTALTLTGSTSGTLAIAATAVAGTNTATFPAATGTVLVSGNQPAFAVTNSSTQSVTSSVFTKVALQTELFDTANAFDSTTNYRFQPTVAGYYQFNATLLLTGTSITQTWTTFFKNGSNFVGSYQRWASLNDVCSNTSALIYLNGSTDYIELYAYIVAVSPAVFNSSTGVQFSGALVRAA